MVGLFLTVGSVSFGGPGPTLHTPHSDSALTSQLWERPESLKGKDWDSATALVVTSINPEGGDWEANTLEGRGLHAAPVAGYLQGRARVEDSAVEISVGVGEGIRLYSSSIPLRRGPVTVSLKVSVSGSGAPRQLGVGLVSTRNGNPDFSRILYSLSTGEEIPTPLILRIERQILLTYDLHSQDASLLLQVIGPLMGVANVRVREIRVFPGWWPTDLTLGPTGLALHENFESDPVALQSSTAGRKIGLFSGDTHSLVPGGLGRCALVRTLGPGEVVQSYLSSPNPLSPVQLPASLEARVWVRRTPGSTGNFALGLSDDDQTVVTVLPIGDLPTDHWQLLRAGGMFTTQGAIPPFVVFQVEGGPATVFVDDIELHAPHDKTEFWDAAYRPTAVPSPVPTVLPTPIPIVVSTPPPLPTVPPGHFIEILSATSSAQPGATSNSAWVVGIDGVELAEPYPAPVTVSGSLLKPVPGTAFVSSASRAGLERTSDNPSRIRFRVPFELPASFTDPHLRFLTSYDGILGVSLNGSSPFATLSRAPEQQPEEISLGIPGGFRPGLNELEIELQNGSPKTVSISFRLVVTYEP